MSYVRFSILPDERCLILGVAKDCNFLKQNTIYEIREMFGELQIVELEQSHLGTPEDPRSSVINGANITQDINTIVSCGGLVGLLATEEEFKNYLNSKHNK